MLDTESFRREHWKLERVLFRKGPPQRRFLDKLFTGRAIELDDCRVAIHDAPTNVLVTGLFGVGKTVFIQELLRQLGDAYGPEMLTIYEALETRGADLLTVILRGLARLLRDEDEEARNVDGVLSGVEVSTERSREVSGELEVGVPGFFKAKTVPEKKGDTTVHTAKVIANVAYHISRLIEAAVGRNPNRQLVVAVDDLDKEDPATIRQRLVEARTTLHRECSFVLTGHPLGVLRDAFATAGGIFDLQIGLPLFSDQELEEMMSNYLEAGRVSGSSVPPLTPFTPAAASAVIARSFGIPRVLNVICLNILRQAATSCMPSIDMPELQQCWTVVAQDLARAIEPELRDLLEVLLEYPDGVDPSDVPDEVFERLGVDSHEELHARMQEAIRSDVAILLQNRVFPHSALLRFSATRPAPRGPGDDQR